MPVLSIPVRVVLCLVGNRRLATDSYQLIVNASDGELSTRQTVSVIIYPHNDRDGDGLEDAWE